MTRPLWLLLLLALGAGLALRVCELGERPMHNDEAVNAIKFRRLWEHGGYKYDPNEHHGPTLAYATLAFERLTGAPDFAHFTEARLRWVTVLFGLGLLALLPLLVDGLGRRGTGWAALFTAVSPALVFYSDYYIHEMLLVFFSALVLAAGWRYWRTRQLGWMLLAGAGLGLLSATKETFVITLFAAGLALALNQTWNRLIDASGAPVKAPQLNPAHLLAGLGVWVVVAAVLFTSFFTNPSGLLDSVRTYTPWLHRAEGASPHIHPWDFYLRRLLFFHAGSGPVWTEGLIFVLALVAAWAGFARRHLGKASASFVRFVALYSFLLGAFYSLLAYKTPWCALGFWHGAVLLAGVGAAVLARALRRRFAQWALSALLVAGAAHLAWLAWLADGAYAADQRNPYVYAQTSPDILNLVSQAEKLAAIAPEGNRLIVQVAAKSSDYWPLPWYFRAYPNVGWYDQLPAPPRGALLVASPEFEAGIAEKQFHATGIYGLRPEVFLELFVRQDLWTAWMAANKVEGRRKAEN